MSITLRLAWRNIWRQPRRTWLTTGAMVFSNVLLVFMISLQFGMYRMMINNTLQTFSGHFQVQAPGYKDDNKMRQSVPDVLSLATRLRQELELDTVAARGVAYVLASSADRTYGIQVSGVETEFEPGVSTLPGLVKSGRFLSNDDAAEIVIGATLAKNLRVGIGDELTLLGSGLDGSFAAAVVAIVGIFESGIPDLDRSIGEMPIRYFQDMFYMNGAGHQVVISLPDLTEVELYKPRVQAVLGEDTTLQLHDWDALQPGLKQAIQADISSAFFMYAILVVLVALSVMNTQLMSVMERTREFGVVMALGLSPGRIGALVLLETALMGLLGLILGALLGAIVTQIVAWTGFTYPGMEEMAANFNLPDRFYPKVSFLSVIIGPAVVFVGGLLAAIYPALRLRWLKPVEAMRAV